MLSGELGFETDTGKLKIGDGSTVWSSLSYFGGSSYVDRGDPAAYDFSKNDLIDSANTWNDLDLSGIVSEGAKAVHLFIYLNPINNDDYVQFRKNGNSNAFNIDRLHAYIGTEDYRRSLIVSLDENRKVEIFSNPKPTTWTSLYITVRGWWV